MGFNSVLKGLNLSYYLVWPVGEMYSYIVLRPSSGGYVTHVPSQIVMYIGNVQGHLYIPMIYASRVMMR